MIETKPGKRTCKYYKACGNAENCGRCESFKKEKITTPSCLTDPDRREELLRRYQE